MDGELGWFWFWSFLGFQGCGCVRIFYSVGEVQIWKCSMDDVENDSCVVYGFIFVEVLPHEKELGILQ